MYETFLGPSTAERTFGEMASLVKVIGSVGLSDTTDLAVFGCEKRFEAPEGLTASV